MISSHNSVEKYLFIRTEPFIGDFRILEQSMLDNLSSTPEDRNVNTRKTSSDQMEMIVR